MSTNTVTGQTTHSVSLPLLEFPTTQYMLALLSCQAFSWTFSLSGQVIEIRVLPHGAEAISVRESSLCYDSTVNRLSGLAPIPAYARAAFWRSQLRLLRIFAALFPCPPRRLSRRKRGARTRCGNRRLLSPSTLSARYGKRGYNSLCHMGDRREQKG